MSKGKLTDGERVPYRGLNNFEHSIALGSFLYAIVRYTPKSLIAIIEAPISQKSTHGNENRHRNPRSRNLEKVCCCSVSAHGMYRRGAGLRVMI